VFLNVETMVDQVDALFSLPALCRQLNRMRHGDAADSARLAEFIGYDPALTATLFRLANAPEFAGPPVESVSAGIARIGSERLAELLALAAGTSEFEEIDPALVDMEDFWHHSLCCALASSSLARQAGLQSPERMFLPGLLHDIGQLVIYQVHPKLSARVLSDSRELESYRYQMEKTLIGVTHAQAGRELLRRWRLPEMVQRAVEFHHEPGLAGPFLVESSILHIATAVANCVEPSWKVRMRRHDAVRQINPVAWEATGLTPAVIDLTVREFCADSIDVLGEVDPAWSSIF